MQYPLLADFNKTVSRDYGVLLENEGIALRGLFLIDPEGVVKHMSINDLPVGRSVEETLRLLKAFQFVEEHGEGELVFMVIMFPEVESFCIVTKSTREVSFSCGGTAMHLWKLHGNVLN